MLTNIQRAVVAQCHTADCSDNPGCWRDHYYNRLKHDNIPFTDPHGGLDMFYSTPWWLTHSDNAKQALQDAGFVLGNASTQNCGYLKQQNVNSHGTAPYLGTLWVRPTDAHPYNATSVQNAAAAIGAHPATLEKALSGTAILIIPAGLAVGVGALIGLCVATKMVSGAARAGRDAISRLARNRRTPDIENHEIPSWEPADAGVSAVSQTAQDTPPSYDDVLRGRA